MARGTRLWTVGAATAAAAAVLVGGFGYFYTTQNQIDLIDRLAAAHGIGPEVDEASLAAHFMERPDPARLTPPQLWVIDREEYAESARAFVEGRLPFDGVRWQPGTRLGWGDETPKSVLFRFQRQVWLMRIAASAPLDIEQEVLLRARDFFAEWRRANRVWPNGNTYAWNDDATSNRIETQIMVMQRLRELGLSDPATELEFLRSMIQHADRLMDEEAHNYRSNHGLMQNAALLTIAVNYPEFDRGGQWRRTAVERTVRHMRETVTEQGVFLELAPGYHWYATMKLLWIVEMCDRVGIEIGETMHEKVRRMLRFCREILHPDRSLPMIADTRGSEADLSGWPFDELSKWPDLEALRRAMAPDPLVPPNAPGAHVWPDSGYFLLRVPAPEWTVDDSLMLTLRTGPRSRAHVHQDALSITLFGRGRPLLSGPGYPAYSPKEHRLRLIGTPSQNALSVNRVSHEPGGSRIVLEDLRLEGDRPAFALVQGESRLYPGVRHRRTVLYGPATDAVLLIDAVVSDEEHVYTQHFRIAEELHAETIPGGVAVKAAEGSEPLLVLDGRLIRGASAGRARWSREGQVQGFGFTGRNGALVTRLALSGTPGGDSLQVAGDRIVWTGDHGRWTARVPIDSKDDYRWTPRVEAASGRSDVESPVTEDPRSQAVAITPSA